MSPCHLRERVLAAIILDGSPPHTRPKAFRPGSHPSPRFSEVLGWGPRDDVVCIKRLHGCLENLPADLSDSDCRPSDLGLTIRETLVPCGTLGTGVPPLICLYAHPPRCGLVEKEEPTVVKTKVIALSHSKRHCSAVVRY